MFSVLADQAEQMNGLVSYLEHDYLELQPASKCAALSLRRAWAACVMVVFTMVLLLLKLRNEAYIFK